MDSVSRWFYVVLLFLPISVWLSNPPPYFQLDSCLCKINSQLLLVLPKKEILSLANFLSLIPVFLEEARHARPPIQGANGAQRSIVRSRPFPIIAPPL